MMGMGKDGNYVQSCLELFRAARPGPWTSVNDVAYADGQIVVVLHTDHFKVQGAHLTNWLSGKEHPRGRFGILAREAVYYSLTRDRKAAGGKA